jgi:hypothetical protein
MTDRDLGRKERPVLITGAHRSGTGWIARVLTASSTPLGYVWEPFSPRRRPGTFPVSFGRYYEYVCAENGDPLVAPVRDLLAFRYRPVAELRSLRSPKDAARMARDWSRFAVLRRRRATPLLKDPIALFSAEWLADSFQFDVVVLIRHPAAFAASIKRRNWRHNFQSFLDQPLLMRDLLGPFEQEIRFHAAERRDILDEAILLWNILYTTVATFRERRPEWLFVRLEDVARAPSSQFRELYRELGLAWEPRVDEVIHATSGPGNPVVESHGGSVRRNSEAHSWSWLDQLSPSEIERVQDGTRETSLRFYGASDWARD